MGKNGFIFSLLSHLSWSAAKSLPSFLSVNFGNQLTNHFQDKMMGNKHGSICGLVVFECWQINTGLNKNKIKV